MIAYSHRYPHQEKIIVAGHHCVDLICQECSMYSLISLDVGTREDLMPSIDQTGNNLFLF